LIIIKKGFGNYAFPDMMMLLLKVVTPLIVDETLRVKVAVAI
jgi:hypothetical protein